MSDVTEKCFDVGPNRSSRTKAKALAKPKLAQLKVAKLELAYQEHGNRSKFSVLKIHV